MKLMSNKPAVEFQAHVELDGGQGVTGATHGFFIVSAIVSWFFHRFCSV